MVIFDSNVLSMKKLYEIALIEKEGLGTAYEYYVKFRILRRYFKNNNFKSILILGLPEKYGFSMDFVLFSHDKGIVPDIYDNRQDKIGLHREIMSQVNQNIDFDLDVNYIDSVSKKYDLVLSCEFFQRLSRKERIEFSNKISTLCKRHAIFVPNRLNKSHVGLSGLNSISKSEMKFMFGKKGIIGYVDAPPFPPGKRAKKKITSNLIIRGLEIYSTFENFISKKYKHIIYSVK